jgi:hypothetical protein
MNWGLLCISFGIWLFWGAHFVFDGRIKQMSDAGVPIKVDGNPFLIASRALCFFALLNIVVFAIIFGIYVS